MPYNPQIHYRHSIRLKRYDYSQRGAYFITICTKARQGKGDHEIWYSPITDRRFVVEGTIKSRHTANGVLKQAGLPKAF